VTNSHATAVAPDTRTKRLPRTISKAATTLAAVVPPFAVRRVVSQTKGSPSNGRARPKTSSEPPANNPTVSNADPKASPELALVRY
jgi:hypothetical protein